MKKGCFLTGLFLLTIILSVVFYMIKNHPSTMISTAIGIAKPVIINSGNKELNEKISKLRLGSNQDTIKAIVNRYFDFLKDSDSLDMDLTGDFMDSIKDAIRDSNVDSSEITNLTTLLNKHIAFYNERSKKN